MVPAGKRFEASNPPRLEIDERLIEQLELILLERPPKLCLDREAAPRLGRLMGLIDLGDSRGLCLFHCELCVPEQLFRILPRVHQRDADCALHADFQFRQLERRGHDLLNALGGL